VGARPEELYVGFEQLGGGLMVVVSSERVVVFTVSAEGRDKPVLTVGLGELELARPRAVRDGEVGESSVVVELVTRGGGALVQRREVRCSAVQHCSGPRCAARESSSPALSATRSTTRGPSTRRRGAPWGRRRPTRLCL
jgi:hypothetical protein